MKSIGILYATREGHTRRIANYVAQKVGDAGHQIEVIDVAHPNGVELDRFDGAILAASVHVWRHEPEMVRFVRRHRLELARLRTAFLSVSMCEAASEDPKTEPKQRLQARLDAFWLMDRFFATTHWHPDIAEPVAGALRYTQYSAFLKLVMQQIARAAGSPTDTSQDHEYTDWKRLDAFVQRYCTLVEDAVAAPVAVA